MSLYGMMFGANPEAAALLATLGLTKDDVGRFRDCHVADGKIAVYTRNGGGNRQCYSDEPSANSAGCGCTGCVMTHRIPKLSFYSHDQDDEFDSTYATVYFNFPPEYADGLRAIDSGEKWDPDARWQALFDSLGAKP